MTRSSPPKQTPPQGAEPTGRQATPQRLAELRGGPDVPQRPLDARALAALAANPGCRRRALLDGAGCGQERGGPGPRRARAVRAVAVRADPRQRVRGAGEGGRRPGAARTAVQAHRCGPTGSGRDHRAGTGRRRPGLPCLPHPRGALRGGGRGLDAAGPSAALAPGGGLHRLSGTGRAGRPPGRHGVDHRDQVLPDPGRSGRPGEGGRRGPAGGGLRARAGGPAPGA